MTYSPPRPIEPTDDISKFDCGEPSLNNFLTKRAVSNNLSGASRTFVTLHDGLVAGYYCLSAGGVQNRSDLMPSKVRRNQPEMVPVALLGRLAVDRPHQGSGIGSSLLKDALLRTVEVSKGMGIRALLVHCLNEDARRFYAKYDFAPSPTNDMHLYLLVKDIEALLE